MELDLNKHEEDFKTVKDVIKMLSHASTAGIIIDMCIDAERSLDNIKSELEDLGNRLGDAEWPLNAPHANPENCPTYYDGCRCSVDTLKHNIDRAETAEAHISVMKENIERLEKERDNAYKKLADLGWSN